MVLTTRHAKVIISLVIIFCSTAIVVGTVCGVHFTLGFLSGCTLSLLLTTVYDLSINQIKDRQKAESQNHIPVDILDSSCDDDASCKNNDVV